MASPLQLPEDYTRMLSIIWDKFGRPDASIPAEALGDERLPHHLLGLLAATGAGKTAMEHFRDEELDTYERHYAPPGWGNLHGHHVEELYGFGMQLVFKLGSDANEIGAWLWKDETDSTFDLWMREGQYRKDRPKFEDGTFEHFLWWRYGDPVHLVSDDEDEEDWNLAALLRSRYHLRKFKYDLTAPAVADFVITLAEASSDNAGRARHKKFGDGAIVKDAGGKVTIAFDDGTERTFLERFIERL